MKGLLRKTALQLFTSVKYYRNVSSFNSVIQHSVISKDTVIKCNFFGRNIVTGTDVIIGEKTTAVNVQFDGINRIGGSSKIANSVIGKYTYTGENNYIHNTEVGKFCSIGPGLKVGIGKHPVNFLSTSPLLYSPNNCFGRVINSEPVFSEYSRIKIGNDVWIGANVFISEGITIEDGAIIGAGSVVTKNVPSYAIVGGVPARVIRFRFDAETIDLLLNLKWWEQSESWIEKFKGFFSGEINKATIQELIVKTNGKA